jgi:hypothetical protein
MHCLQSIFVDIKSLFIPFVYRTRARAIFNLFYWLPYDPQFINKSQELQEIDGTSPLVLLGDNTTDWNLAWSEAGYRLGKI